MGVFEVFRVFLANNAWVALAVIVSGALWVSLKRRHVDMQNTWSPPVLQLLNVVSGGLVAMSILSVYAVFGIQFDQNDNLAGALEFAAYLGIYVALSLTVARSIELFWISRIAFLEDAYIPGLPRLLLFGATLIIGLTAFGVGYGLSINGLYVSTGAMAAIIAFAMQRTLGDLFSGVSLSVEHPFKVGDWIELEDGTRGEVRDLNWRATRLRDWDNTTIVVPNSKLAAQSFRNYKGPKQLYSPVYTVKLPGEIDPRFAKSLMLEVALKCKRRSMAKLPSVRLVDSGTVPYSYMIWLHFQDYPAMFAGREEFFRNLHYALKQAGIQSAPVAQDVRFKAADRVEAKPPSLQHALGSLDFAQLFNEEELDTLIARSYAAFFDSGATILQEGKVAPSVYIVLNGIVDTSIVDAQGKTRVMAPLRSGEYFGLASMLTDAPSFQSFAAATDVSLIQVDRKCFKEIASKRADLLQGFAAIVESRMSLVEQTKSEADVHRNSGKIFDVLRKIETMLNQ